MPYASNALDGSRVYFEDDGGDGAAVVLHGGLLDRVDLVRGSHVARALQRLPEEFRLIYADHRGLGRSDKPHEVEAYAMPLRVGDAVAVLDELAIERAHFIGNSWGGRLGFGIGEHAPERVVSLVIGGQQPYAINPDGPLARAVAQAVSESRREGSLEPFVEALESFAGTQLPDELRTRWLDNDPAAIDAAWSAGMAEGDISEDLGAWDVRCLIYVGAGDVDFHDQARRAAGEIPRAEFISLENLEHVGAHLASADPVLPAVLGTLRGNHR
ncbi:MAG TPA: alpha/beta hydrolase [Rubrobacter sp.]|nr:alpha/beta hydrolase [Rubrobacter sp.]